MKTAIAFATVLVALGGGFPVLAQTASQPAASPPTTAPAPNMPGMPGIPRSVTDAIGQKTGTTVLTGSYLREVDENEPLLGPGNLTVRQMEDARVMDSRGQAMGEVEEVIANNRGRIVGVTAEVGGFLGVGEKEVLIPLEHLTVRNGQFQTDLTQEQLKALPRWDDD
ncbi:PRC-barrel domain-containing protein [Pedomonas mirosovicensis]|uniref:PRC-barrel domain-containing protein n=1 Tax=Pedomonas mirosovicensis TaxID=2908641 RepID=UPI0021699EA2|nr:PRC-barrel domain-containing protein [Pedomonas mirosovicensis]MCH8686117.1 PRC-barrel domain-containing protein [Pedomonas mirosovicensis]